MKRILLPTDFSDNAYNAIQYALQMFKEDSCEFFIVHTYTPVMISSGSMLDSETALSLHTIAEKSAQKKMNALLDKTQSEFPNPKHSIKGRVSFNLLLSEMENLINENNIDVVVMGTQGATGAKEVFIGTQTMYAIKKLNCPLLAVPANFDYEAPKDILFPTDFNLRKTNKYLTMLREFCNSHVSRLHILNAYYGYPLTDAQLETKSFLDNYFTHTAHLFHLGEGGDVLEAIEQFQIKIKINLMVMIHNKHNFLENMLFRPVINQVVYHTQVPFLVIPSEERQ
jgi:nucleotide-binding universal stress UspA family protein